MTTCPRCGSRSFRGDGQVPETRQCLDCGHAWMGSPAVWDEGSADEEEELPLD